MGECGCGEMNNIREIVRISEFILVVEIYTGCRYCHTGVMTSLHLFTEEEAKAFQLVPTGVFEPNSSLHYPIVGQEDLAEASKVVTGISRYANLSGWLSDYGRELLQEAINIRQKKTIAQQRCGMSLSN